MQRDAFEPNFESMPPEIAIFPLPGVILLPRVQLPLNIFEPRYLAMTEFALSSSRLIGMIQPKPSGAEDDIFMTGCAGRISSFSETEDGRYLITLKGVSRFQVAEELPLSNAGFRRVRADWQPFKNDFTGDTTTDICRDSMMGTLRAYLDKMDMFCDKWDAIRHIDCERLISTLSVVCPFSTEEKQALLEADTLPERVRILTALLEIAAKDCGKSCH